MKLTIVVPAFNEEAHLAPTLNSIRAATDYLGTRSDADVDVDADVAVPPTLLHAIHETMRDPACIGGGVDVDFYRALRRLARQERRTVRLIRQPRVQPSCRRFDTWPLWRILVWTNPLFIALFRRWKTAWPGWYSDAVR